MSKIPVPQQMLCTTTNSPSPASKIYAAGDTTIPSDSVIGGGRRNFRRIKNRTCNRKIKISQSLLFRFGHDRKTTRSRGERGSSLLLMRRRTNQRGESTFHPLTFNASDSHERVLHRGAPHDVEAVRRKRTWWRRVVVVLVEAATERTGMRRRRTHTRSLLNRDVAVVICDDVAGNGPVRWNGPVESEPDRGRWRGRSVVQVDTCGRSGTVRHVWVRVRVVEETWWRWTKRCVWCWIRTEAVRRRWERTKHWSTWFRSWRTRHSERIRKKKERKG